MEPERPGEDFFGRTDQAVTHNAGIYSVLIHGGREPEYHTNKDTLEKLDLDRIKHAAELGFLVTSQLADTSKTPKLRRRTRRTTPLNPY